MSVNPIKDSGIGSVVIDNEDFEGSGAFIVLTRDKNDIILQMKTIISGQGMAGGAWVRWRYAGGVWTHRERLCTDRVSTKGKTVKGSFGGQGNHLWKTNHQQIERPEGIRPWFFWRYYVDMLFPYNSVVPHNSFLVGRCPDHWPISSFFSTSMGSPFSSVFGIVPLMP